jgi:hypothetical protein
LIPLLGNPSTYDLRLVIVLDITKFLQPDHEEELQYLACLPEAIRTLILLNKLDIFEQIVKKRKLQLKEIWPNYKGGYFLLLPIEVMQGRRVT